MIRTTPEQGEGPLEGAPHKFVFVMTCAGLREHIRIIPRFYADGNTQRTPYNVSYVMLPAS